MNPKVRWTVALSVLLLGTLASTATSQLRDKICFYQVSCGDKMLPCVCLSDEVVPYCHLCTGVAIGNFCFDCPGQVCESDLVVTCGKQYDGVCIRPAEGSPRVCIGMTFVGTCGAAICW
jgi:hypothetical protein